MSETKEKTLVAKIEALLFAYGAPIELKKLADVLGISIDKLEGEIGDLKSSLISENRGLDLVLTQKEVQLVTSPELSSTVSTLVKNELDTKLTPASLEVLTIVAYLGPCTKALIEYIRGVNSSFTLRNLMIRGLVERKSDTSSSDGYLYQATFDFLKHMGVASQEQLPDYDKYAALAKNFAKDDEDKE